MSEISGRLTPEDFFGLLCDYVRADGWVQRADGWWFHPEDEPEGVTLIAAVRTTLRFDGISQNRTAPPVKATFGPGFRERLKSEVGQVAAVGIGVLAFIVVAAIVALAFLLPAYSRYQKRANANNNVKVSAIQIRNQEQRVQIAKQHAQIRFQNAIGIREAQDEIAKTLTPLYVQFEMTQALQAIATSGKNNTVIYLPTSPTSGLPVVPTSNVTPPIGAKP